MSAWTGTRVALLANRARLLAERASQSSVRAALTLALVACLAPVPVAVAADPPPLTVSTGTDGSGGSTVTVTGSRFFELRFNTRRGGGIDQFFDLAADSFRNYDLAGGGTTADALFSDELDIDGGLYYIAADNTATAAGASGTLDLLEATPTRARVRGEAFYQRPTGLLGGVKGIGDYTLLPSGRMAIRWNRSVTTTSTSYRAEEVEIITRYQTSGPLSNWVLRWEGHPATPGDADFTLSQIEQPLVVTDFLQIAHKDDTPHFCRLGSSSDFLTNVDVYWQWDWGCNLMTARPLSTRTWNFLTYFKPTTFADQNDPNVTRRSNDYRSPALLTTSWGSPWADPAENTTLGTDWFNESEAAYPLDMDLSLGLDFNFDVTGSPAQPRYSPFFKIRKWHSLAPPRTITFAGRTLIRHIDYKADLKPVSRAHWAPELLWHCSMEGSCSPPDVGSGGGQTAGVGFVPGRYGKAAAFGNAADYISAPAANFNRTEGAVEFWYQPSYANTDLQNHVLWLNWDGINSCVFLWKGADSKLYLTRNASCTPGGSQVAIPVTSYSWRAYDWVHLEVSWSSIADADGAKLRVLVNGQRVGQSGSPLSPPSGTTYFGGCAGNCVAASFPGGIVLGANGLIDEPHIYGALEPVAAPSQPTRPLANGGLLSDTTREYLASASPAQNFSLAFTAVDTTRRGPYLYLGADSKFRGLNVWLETPGSGSTLAWEYWSVNGGTGVGVWTSLPGLFGNSNLTADGPVHWAEPTDWAPYSVEGGPDLYYVRVHLPNGAVPSSPKEGQIKTDILLLGYEGDISGGNQSFVIEPPPLPWTDPLIDLQITKTVVGSTTVKRWETVQYQIDVTNNDLANDANDVKLHDRLPEGIEFVSYDAPGMACGYSAPTRLFSCSSGNINRGQTATVRLNVIAMDEGLIENTASVTARQPDPNSTNDSSSVVITVGPPDSSRVEFLTVTSRDGVNVVAFWNPAGVSLSDCAAQTRLFRKEGSYPTDPNDPDLTVTPITCSADAPEHKKCTCTDSTASNDTTYFYGAFPVVSTSPLTYGPGRFATGRPFDTSGVVKWAFSTGTFAVAAPTVTEYGVIAPSNDRVVYSMQRGCADCTRRLNPSGGEWPANWTPAQLGGIVQSRSPFVPASAVGEDTIYLGAQDGRVYALNAQTGARKAGWTDADLGGVVQAAPAGIFTQFGGTVDSLFVGTRNATGTNTLYRLDPITGATTPFFINGGALGPISSMAAVDYAGANSSVCLTTLKWSGVGDNYFCLDVQTAARKRWGPAAGDIDSSPIFSNDQGGTRRVYFASPGQIYSYTIAGDAHPDSFVDGAVKGFVFPDRLSIGDLYFASTGYVWAYTDTTTSLVKKDYGRANDGNISLTGSYPAPPAVPAVRPSSPVLLASSDLGTYLYVGGTDGKLYRIDKAAGSVAGWVQLGAGNAVVGAPSYDSQSQLIHVGTEAGIFYAVDASVPWP